MDFGYFQAKLTVAKIEYYINTIRKRPTSKKFLLGWISRSSRVTKNPICNSRIANPKNSLIPFRARPAQTEVWGTINY